MLVIQRSSTCLSTCHRGLTGGELGQGWWLFFAGVIHQAHHLVVGVCTFSLCCVNKSPIHCDWVAVGIDLLPSSM